MKAKLLSSKFKVLIVIVSILLSACDNNVLNKENLNLSEVEEDMELNSIMEPEADFKSSQLNNYIDIKIIKSANTRYKVMNVEKSSEEIKDIAYEFGAYISDLRFENSTYKIENRFTIKVPNKNFYDLLSTIKKTVENVDYENITTRDVTEEYTDLETRLKTKIEVKSRYEEVLRKNANTVEEILATEDKLRIIQEEIESAQGRLDYLSNKVAFSTIQIDLYEEINLAEINSFEDPSFWEKSGKGLIFGWDFVVGILIGIIHIWPIIILAAIIFFIWKNRRLKA